MVSDPLSSSKNVCSKKIAKAIKHKMELFEENQMKMFWTIL
jgi:hypothetical protein